MSPQNGGVKWGHRPKLARFSHEQMQEFKATFPHRVAFHEHPEIGRYGTDYERPLIEAFFRTINSPVVTTTNAIYLTTDTDVTLLLLGLYR